MLYSEKFCGWVNSPADESTNWDKVNESLKEIAGYGKVELKGTAGAEYALPLKSWQQKYQAYLRSEDWRWLRDRKLKETKGLCERCGKTADVVHHLTYAGLTETKDGRLIDNSELCDLQSLDFACHNYAHKRGPDPLKQNPKTHWTEDAQRLEDVMKGGQNGRG